MVAPLLLNAQDKIHRRQKKKLPGTAEGQGSAGLEGGPRNVALPRPTIEIHLNLRKYLKVHRFFTWGIAYHIINKTMETDPKEEWNFMTTPLAHVPWDRPYFYLTPSEYNVLPNGCSVKHVEVTVIPRNVRIAFPTNSTANNLATLNQNKDLIVSKGLQINCHTINAHYTSFQAEQPMIATDFEIENHNIHTDLATDLYGKTNYTQTIVPRHQMGIPTPLPTYAIIPHSSTAENNNFGWPCLQHFYSDFDADATTGNHICKMEYSPTVGIIKKPIRSRYEGFRVINDPDKMSANNKVIIPRGSHVLNRQEQIFSFPTISGESTIQSEATKDMSSTDSYDWNVYHDLIEKSQDMQYGNFEAQMPTIQPSLHIGIQPVPALTTASLQGQSNSTFTDASAYFEVIAEMVLEESYPTPYPLATEIHTTEHGQVWMGGNYNNHSTYIKSTFNGLYQS